MKIIQYVNGTVIDILNAREDVTNDNIAVVDSIPSFEPQEGYNGILKYGENGLYWDYELAPTSDEISDTEARNIIIGGDPK